MVIDSSYLPPPPSRHYMTDRKPSIITSPFCVMCIMIKVHFPENMKCSESNLTFVNFYYLCWRAKNKDKTNEGKLEHSRDLLFEGNIIKKKSRSSSLTNLKSVLFTIVWRRGETCQISLKNFHNFMSSYKVCCCGKGMI